MSIDDGERGRLAPLLRQRNIGGYQKHFFLCTAGSCCDNATAEASWAYLKKRCAELGLTDGPLYRSKAGCLRLCQAGPIGVVYPDGTWYGHLTPANIERVLQEHILGGRPVDDLLIATNPLPSPSSPVTRGTRAPS